MNLGASEDIEWPREDVKIRAKRQVYVIENSRNSTSIGQMFEVNRPS